jgi:hypothetical protein
MADIKISALGALAEVDINVADVVAIVDVSDTTQAPSGSTKKTTTGDLTTYIHNNLIARVQLTGDSSVTFTAEEVYNTATTPLTGNITVDQTDAILGVVQKMYHNDATAPTITGVTDVQLMGDGVYFTGLINVIYFEWTETDRVEYWIVQEQ